MRLQIHFRLLIGLVFLVLCFGLGCKSSSKSDYYMANSYNNKIPPTTGSIAEMKEKMERKAAKEAAKPKKPGQLAPVIVLVRYNDQGIAIGIDLRQSSGDAETDRRAMEHAYTKMKYPKGKGDIVLITIEPKSLPKSK